MLLLLFKFALFLNFAELLSTDGSIHMFKEGFRKSSSRLLSNVEKQYEVNETVASRQQYKKCLITQVWSELCSGGNSEILWAGSIFCSSISGEGLLRSVEQFVEPHLTWMVWGAAVGNAALSGWWFVPVRDQEEFWV